MVEKQQDQEQEEIELIQDKKHKPSWKGYIEVSGWIEKDKMGVQHISCKISNYFKLYPVMQKA